ITIIYLSIFLEGSEIPLTKVKTMRKTLSGKNMLNNLLKEHAYRLSQICFRGLNITIHPLRNIMDVSAHLICGCPPTFASVQPVVSTDTPYPDHHSLGCSTQVRFRHYKSSTFWPTQKTFSIAYGSGNTKGFLMGDLVSTEQPFSLSMAENGFQGIPFAGVLGLNYPNISFIGAIPIFDKLKNQGAISEPVFAFYLSNVVMFGRVDKAYYQEMLNWVPLIQVGDWRAHMDHISMKRKVIACSGGCKPLVDTRTSLILGPRRLVNNIQKLIGATPQVSEHYISCFAVNTLPSTIFTINGIKYPVLARAYILKDSRGHCYTTFKENTVRTSRETWMLGDVFLRQYFSVYDRGNDRIGLAQAV
uniref:Pregnancy-associated glycoprotein 1-like n=1 Tax=Bos indicus x Bos taurus TaxID=30522 RepID=A0A4W2HFY0_BOBOX